MWGEWWLAALIVAALLVLVLAFFISRKRSPEKTEPAPTMQDFEVSPPDEAYLEAGRPNNYASSEQTPPPLKRTLSEGAADENSLAFPTPRRLTPSEFAIAFRHDVAQAQPIHTAAMASIASAAAAAEEAGVAAEQAQQANGRV